MLTVVLLTPLLASLVLRVGAPRIGRLLPPALSTVCLAVASVITALSTGFMLSLLGFCAVAQFAPVANTAGWSATTLDAHELLPGPISVAAGAAALVLLAAGIREIVQTVRKVAIASRLCAALGPDAAGLIITDEDQPEAFAVSGFRSARIVVSRSMLRALDPAERRALLAHEQAHINQRHHVYLHLVDLACAANPLLRPMRREVRLGVERWADEAAAEQTGDRRVVARALARAGLAQIRAGTPTVSAGLAAVDVELKRRMQALLDDTPRGRPLVVAAVAFLVIACVTANGLAAQQVDHRFDRADLVFDQS